MKRFLAAAAVFFALLPVMAFSQNTTNFARIGRVDRFDSSLDGLISKEAVIEVLCGGFDWAEGPVWVPEKGNKFGGYVLFSDIPPNSVIKWQEGVGSSLFLKPSGYTGAADYGREPGSNGLALDTKGRLVSCEHGDRRISVLTSGGGSPWPTAGRASASTVPTTWRSEATGTSSSPTRSTGCPGGRRTPCVRSISAVSTACRRMAPSACNRRRSPARTGSPFHRTTRHCTWPIAMAVICLESLPGERRWGPGFAPGLF